jgi:hypothetical protein
VLWEKKLQEMILWNFFRNDEKLNELSVDDRIEIFSTILLGSSDFKKKLFDQIFIDYEVRHLEVIEKKDG